MGAPALPELVDGRVAIQPVDTALVRAAELVVLGGPVGANEADCRPTCASSGLPGQEVRTRGRIGSARLAGGSETGSDSLGHRVAGHGPCAESMEAWSPGRAVGRDPGPPRMRL